VLPADMSPGLLLSIGLGFLAFAALLEWPLRRRRAAKFALLAEQFEKLRRLAESERRYVAPGSSPLASAEGYARAEAELAGLGFVAHADLEEVGDDGTAYGIARWFIGAEGSVVARYAQVSAPLTKASRPVMIFFSEAAPGRFCFTGRGIAEPGLALPKGVRRLVLPWSVGAAVALRRHRQALRGESMMPESRDARRCPGAAPPPARRDPALARCRAGRGPAQRRHRRGADAALSLLRRSVARGADRARNALAAAPLSSSSRPRPCARPRSC